jgi:ATP citrate (pro-S)-lyase
MRVTIMKEYAKKHFKSTPLLDFALEVEKVTTAKKDNLILNVDGCIGICFVDMLRNEMPKKEADEYIQMGALNGLFVVGRTIGMTAHVLDQKRLKQGLYRHPWDDITYMTE